MAGPTRKTDNLDRTPSAGKNLRIEDIALASGVSSATVSNVLNNRANTASPKTRERVLAVVREMNYRPRALASGTRAKTSNTIGVMLVQPKLSDSGGLSYLNCLVSGILPVALEERYFVTLYGNFEWPDTREALRVYCDGRCDGMIVIVPPTGSEFITALQERGIPFVTITETDMSQPLSSVDIDNEQAARDVVTYLYNLGHRRIAYFGGSEILLTAQRRTQGFFRGLADVGLEPDESLIYRGDYGYAAGEERAARLYADVIAGRCPTPTALFCANDTSAFGAISVLQARGIRIPEDLSVIGFDDIPAASEHTPPLTTVRQPLAEMGAEAVRLLLETMRNAESGQQSEAVHRRLTATIAVRGTTAAPPPESHWR